MFPIFLSLLFCLSVSAHLITCFRFSSFCFFILFLTFTQFAEPITKSTQNERLDNLLLSIEQLTEISIEKKIIFFFAIRGRAVRLCWANYALLPKIQYFLFLFFFPFAQFTLFSSPLKHTVNYKIQYLCSAVCDGLLLQHSSFGFRCVCIFFLAYTSHIRLGLSLYAQFIRILQFVQHEGIWQRRQESASERFVHCTQTL